MCILVHAVKRQPLELPLEERISNALVEVGPSITLASLSEVLAFAVGTFIPMPACRVFSMFAGRKLFYLVQLYGLYLLNNRFSPSFYLMSVCFCFFILILFCSTCCSSGLPPASYCICCFDSF